MRLRHDDSVSYDVACKSSVPGRAANHRKLLMSESRNHRQFEKASICQVVAGCVLAAGLVLVLGCAQAESRNWAQTSPLIEPEKRAEASFHLSAHDDACIDEEARTLHWEK